MSTQLWIVLAVIAAALIVLAVVLVSRSRTSARPGVGAPIVTGRSASPDEPSGAPPPRSGAEPSADAVGGPGQPQPSAPTTEIEELAGFEIPDSAVGRMHRLRARLARSNSAIGKGLLGLLGRDLLDQSTWDAIEETLLAADLGVTPTMEIVEQLRTAVRVEGSASQERLTQLLREALLRQVDPGLDRSLATLAPGRPAVVLVVGVNGTGKTTTTGKLARLLIAEGQTVLLGAADTFRAAAAEQLQTWGDRVGAPVVRGPEGGDPAAVAFDAVATATAAELDTAVIDTAGRLHTKAGLMDELGKVKRVIEKQSPVDEVLLV
ncbi:MAG: signal recognition particle receptor subunit alpha, partial [Candidatus Nanopelagicales bacterium]|nr:signal recognition particle receptor subunit alpha [Candidatus Nanopelagicales bacterium]